MSETHESPSMTGRAAGEGPGARRNLNTVLGWFALPGTQALLALAAVGLTIYCAAMMLPERTEGLLYRHPLQDALLAAVFGGLLLGAAGVWRSATRFDVPDRVPSLRRAGLEGWALGAGIVLLAVVAEAGASALDIALLDHMSHHVQHALLVLGLALVAFGLGGRPGAVPAADASSAESDPDTQRHPLLYIPWWEVLALAAILLFAGWLRVLDLRDGLRISIDEYNFISDMLLLWEQPAVNLLEPMTGVVPFTRVHTYWSSWTVEFFGRDWGGLRGASVVVGTLTVAGIWLLGRNLFDRATGLVAALVLATFPPHIHFSRLVLNNITDPLFGVLAFGFLARGLRSRSQRDYALAGVMLGLTAYFYEAGRLFYPVLMVCWLGWLWLWALFRGERFPWRGAGVLAAGFVISAAPVYYVILAMDLPLAIRLGQAGRADSYLGALFGDDMDARRDYFRNLEYAFRYYINLGEVFVHYGRELPLVLPPLVPAFVLGVWVALWRLFRQAGMALLLGWLVGTSLGTSLMAQSMVSTRYVAVFPALALVIAVGLRYIAPLLAGGLAPLLERRQAAPARTGVRYAAAGLLAAVTLGLALWSADFYHNTHLPAFNLEIREIDPHLDVDDALIRAAQLPPGTQVTLVTRILSNGLANRDAVRFFADGIDILTTFSEQVHDDSMDPYFDGLDRDRVQAFFVAPDDAITLAKLRARFPLPDTPVFSPYADVPEDEQFALYIYTPRSGPPVPEAVPESTPEPAPESTPETVPDAGGGDGGADNGDGSTLPTDEPLPPTEPSADTGGTVTVADMQWVTAPYAEPRPARHGGEIRAISRYGTLALLLLSMSYGVFGLVVARADAAISAGWPSALGRGRRLVERFAGAWRAPLAYALLLIAVGLVLLATRGFRPEQLNSAGTAALLTLAAGLLFGVAAALRPSTLPPLFTLDAVRTASLEGRVRWWPLVAGAAMLALLTSINAGGWPHTTLAAVQLALLAGGAVCVTYGLMGEAEAEPPPRQALSITCGEWLALAVIVGVALVARVHNLEYAVHRFMDEIHSISAIIRLWENPNTPILTPHGTITAFTWVYPMLQTVTETVYGPTLTALRVVSAGFGVGTVLALWWLARILFNPRIALVAALLLATFPVHVHFSRIGLNNAADPFFGTLALAFLARGLRDRRQADFALAGLMLGATQYFYEGGRLLYPALAIAFVVAWMWLARTSPATRAAVVVTRRELSAFVAVFVLLAAPVYVTLIAGDELVAPRFDEQFKPPDHWEERRGGTVFASAWNFVQTDLRDPFWYMVQHPEKGWFYGGQQALVLNGLLPLFLVGGMAAFWRLRAPGEGWRGAASPGMALLLLWIGGTAAGNSLLYARMESARYVVMHPAVALLMAVGAAHLASLLLKPPGRALPGLAGVGLLVIAVYGGVQQTRHYFDEHLGVYGSQVLRTTLDDDMMFRLTTLPDVLTDVYIIKALGLWRYDLDTWLRYTHRMDDLRIFIIDPPTVTDAWLRDLSTNRNAALFLEPGHAALQARMDDYFSLLRVHESPFDMPPGQQFRLYYVAW